MLKVRLNKLIDDKIIDSYQKKVEVVNDMIQNKSGVGNDYLGWVDWPINYDQAEVKKIIADAAFVRENFEVLVVCGVGGSYLGAKSAIEALKGLKDSDKFAIIFMGHTFSPNYVAQVLNYLHDKKFAINVISKSGTTTETSVAFRLLKQLLETKLSKSEIHKAVYATTSKNGGALKQLAEVEGYTTYVLPEDIGGRYSVLTPVGLFPLAVAGIDIEAMLLGAEEARRFIQDTPLKNNYCYQYAIMRDYMYRHHKQVEMYVTYEPQMSQLSEWLKQLFGESEGKGHKGLFPASATFTTDLHSLGQFIQDGTPLLFETIINVIKPVQDVTIPSDADDLDGLNYLAGKNLAFVNQKAFEGTLKAHEDGGVPCNVIVLDCLDAYMLGYLFYFFMRACAMSAYLLEINPFDQPGVEIYKKNMFRLLGKKGH